MLLEDLLFFALSVGYTTAWTALSSELGVLKTLHGPNVLLYLNIAYFAPSIPVLALQICYDSKINQKIGTACATLWRHAVTLPVSFACCILLPLVPWTSLTSLLVISVVIGTAASVAFGSSSQLVARFPPSCGQSLALGIVSSGPVILLFQFLFSIGPHATHIHQVFFFLSSAVLPLLALGCLLLLLYRYWKPLQAGTALQPYRNHQQSTALTNRNFSFTSQTTVAAVPVQHPNASLYSSVTEPLLPSTTTAGVLPSPSGPFSFSELPPHSGMYDKFKRQSTDDVICQVEPTTLENEDLPLPQMDRDPTVQDLLEHDDPPFSLLFIDQPAIEPDTIAAVSAEGNELSERPVESFNLVPPNAVTNQIAAMSPFTAAPNQGDFVSHGDDAVSVSTTVAAPPASAWQDRSRMVSELSDTVELGTSWLHHFGTPRDVYHHSFTPSCAGDSTAPSFISLGESAWTTAPVVRAGSFLSTACQVAPVAMCLFSSVMVSVLLFPAFTVVRSSGMLGCMLPQALFAARMMSDILGRCLASLGVPSLRVVSIVAAAKTAMLPFGLIYLWLPTELLDDSAAIGFVIIHWVLSGLVGAWSFMLLPRYYQGPEKAAYAGSCMSAAYQVGTIMGLVFASILERFFVPPGTHLMLRDC